MVLYYNHIKFQTFFSKIQLSEQTLFSVWSVSDFHGISARKFILMQETYGLFLNYFLEVVDGKWKYCR